MIDISQLEVSPDVLQVQPSNNIFAELGNNTYDYKDLLSELIDNAIAARIPHQLLEISVYIYVDETNKAQKFVVRDNASGIPKDQLGLAITPAGIQRMGSLNEHGLGMKQAVSALGKLEYLATKTKGEDKARVVREFRFGDLPTYRGDFSTETGTEISVTDLRPIVVTHAGTITRTIVPYLGARYRRFLKPENRDLDLRIIIMSSVDQSAQYNWLVEEVKPVYFHPQTRENRPVILRYPISGNGWDAQLTFGYAPANEAEYEELGLERPNKFHPYRVSLTHQGLDIILHDRVILFHQLSELGIVTQKHNEFNEVRGEITLLKGFATAITKNSMIFDIHFKECIDEVCEILNGKKTGPGDKKHNYLRRKTYPEELPEKLLCDRLIEWLANNPLEKRTNINKQYAVEGIEGFIDILADGEAWELKVDQANALDVYQLFMYMDVGQISKGFLVANAFSPGAEVAKQFIQKTHDKEIILAQRNSFPINHPPTSDEREEYY